ncbi:MAG: ribonuclease P protein component [Deltaproteobacteria bacterium HGW-Deltaproteobacteria-4]|nr:MAG: ribonuclease P protein component [Deltaproteobacteria bacterium HGW-Deltaproteobacteria-4]
MQTEQPLDFSFPKDCRIRKHNIYQLLFRKGRRIALPHFVIYYMIRDNGPARLGTTVSRKVGNAVARNHCKRQLKEFFRSIRHVLLPSVDLSILARPGAAQLTSQQGQEELLKGLRSAALVNLS